MMKKSHQIIKVKTDLSSQKQYQQRQISRKKSKNLYTLNKQSQNDDDEQMSEESKSSKNNKNSKKVNKSAYDFKKRESEAQAISSEEQVKQKQKNKYFNKKAKSKQSSSQQSPSSSQQDSQSQYIDQQINTPSLYQKPLEYHRQANSQFHEQDHYLQMQMRIKKLQQQNQLLQVSLSTHQKRQIQMVGKFASLVAQNKKLQYQVIQLKKTDHQSKEDEKRIKNQQKSIKQQRNQLEKEMKQFDNQKKKTKEEGAKFIVYLKGVMSKLQLIGRNNLNTTQGLNAYNSATNSTTNKLFQFPTSNYTNNTNDYEQLRRQFLQLSNKYQLVSKDYELMTKQTQYTKRQSKALAQYLQKCISALSDQGNTNKASTQRNERSTSNQHQPKRNVPNNDKQNVIDNINLSSSNMSNTLFQPSLQSFSFFNHLSLYQPHRITLLSQQNQILHQQISKLKQHFIKLSQGYKKSFMQKQQLFKKQKRDLCQKYHKVIEQVKQKALGLENNVKDQQNKFQAHVRQLETVLEKKDKIINKLKSQLKQLNIKLDQIQEERFQLLRQSMSRKQNTEKRSLVQKQRQKGTKQSKYSKTKYINGDYIQQSSSDLSENYGRQPNSPSHLTHEQSFYEYNPYFRKDFEGGGINQKMMRKSHKSRVKPQKVQFQKEQKDLRKINKEIQQLEKQIMMQFDNQL